MRTIHAVGGNLSDLVDDLLRILIGDLTKDGVCTGQVWGLADGDEELRTVGTWASVRHGQQVWTVERKLWVEFIAELVARATTTGAGWVAALDHESVDDAVEDGAVVERTFLATLCILGGVFLGSLGQTDEVFDGYWCVIAEQLNHDIAMISMQSCLGSGFTHAHHYRRQHAAAHFRSRPAATTHSGFSVHYGGPLSPQHRKDATTMAGAHRAEPVTPPPRPQLTRVGWWYTIRRIVVQSLRLQIPDMGAGLTYFTLLALAPTLLVFYGIGVLIMANNRDLLENLLWDFLGGILPVNQTETVLNTVDTVLSSTSTNLLGLLAGVVLAAISSSAYVRAFARFSTRVYGDIDGRPLLHVWSSMALLSVAMILGVCLIFLALVVNVTVVETLIQPIAGPLGIYEEIEFLTTAILPIWAWVRWPVIVIMAAGLISVLYYYAPNVRPYRSKWRIFTLGAFVALVLIFLTGGGLYVYFVHLSSLNSYGALGSIVTFFFGCWIANTSLVFGVVIDAEVERTRQIREGILDNDPTDNTRLAEQTPHLEHRSTKQQEKMERVLSSLENDAQQLKDAPQD